jgi:hypothetical protein
MVIMEPCGRLRVILAQMVGNIVGGANPSNKKGYERLMNESLPELERRAYDLAEKCRALGGCEGDLCDIETIKKIFERAYYDLETRFIK